MRYEVADFTPWHPGTCESCGVPRLVTGPNEGPERCWCCWRSEIDDPPRGSRIDDLALLHKESP